MVRTLASGRFGSIAQISSLTTAAGASRWPTHLQCEGEGLGSVHRLVRAEHGEVENLGRLFHKDFSWERRSPRPLPYTREDPARPRDRCVCQLHFRRARSARPESCSPPPSAFASRGRSDRSSVLTAAKYPSPRSIRPGRLVRLLGPNRMAASTPAKTRASPRAPPTGASIMLSVRKWRTIRPRPAPNAIRTATSRRRPSTRNPRFQSADTQRTEASETQPRRIELYRQPEVGIRSRNVKLPRHDSDHFRTNDRPTGSIDSVSRDPPRSAAATNGHS